MNLLKNHIINLIHENNGLGIAHFMTELLLHPEFGYYASRDPLSSQEDFITAPLQGQMFGEIMGLWVIKAWEALGKPDFFYLVEMGAGTGHMMSDILRVLKINSPCYQAVHIALIEASAALKNTQAQKLFHSSTPVSWYDRLDQIPEKPMIILGNEFLDCLPIRQFIFYKNAWHERMVTLEPSPKGKEDHTLSLAFTRSSTPLSPRDLAFIPERLGKGKENALVEVCPSLLNLVDQISQRFHKYAGIALFIDYGSEKSTFGDTLQAIKNHQKQSPLENLGEADLTAHVDFETMRKYALSLKLNTSRQLSQGDFLKAMGIETRAAILARNQTEKRAYILRQLWRLTDVSQMGNLFRTICLTSPAIGKPEPFLFHR